MTGDRLTLGVVTPHRAAGPEVELPAISGGRVRTVVHRTGPSLRASTETDALDLAATAFAAETLDVVAHASTSTGYVIGHAAESELAERLADRCGVPAVTSCAAAAAALRAYAVERLQVVHPPWFDDELDDLGADYFRDAGLDVVVTRATTLPHDPAQVRTHHVTAWVGEHVVNGVEAIYLGGNGFRAAAAVEAMERQTGRLVLQANQALLWAAITATGTEWHLAGQGRLLGRGSRAPRT